MLARVLEPEVMDTPEEARDYDSMDHSEVNRVFAGDFLALWDTEIPIELCRQSPRPEVIAIDLADHMLALASANVERARLGKRVRVEKADAKRFDYPEEHFGDVISNSIIHHIPEPFACFAEMHRVCAEEGTLFVRDLLRPPDLTTLTRLVDSYAAGANDHQRAMFTASLHAALTLDEVRAMVGRLGYAPGTVQQTTDRHWTFTAYRGDPEPVEKL